MNKHSYWLKGCNRCGGDLLMQDDRYGEYVACIQCGHEPPENNAMTLLDVKESLETLMDSSDTIA